MTADGTVDTERTAVKTYVPAYQKREWKDHAEELGMSQSEFVRTMVQAGRRGFEPPESDAAATDADRSTSRDRPADPGSNGDRSSASNPRGSSGEDGAADDGGDELKSRVVSVLERESVLAWDDLLEQVTDDIERRLDEAIQDLQAENRVRYSGREGGYTLADRR